MRPVFIHAPLIVILIFNISNLYAQTHTTDFRGAKWGMSPSQVKGTESGTPFYETNSTIVYKDTIAGLSCNVGYVFAYNKLVRAKYIITENHTNRTDYLYDFKKLSDRLSEKYGKPFEEKTHWKNSLYRNEPNEWGMAIAVGHLVKFSKWETPTTSISLIIFGDNYKINFGIEYGSIELKSLEEKATKEKEQKKF